MRRKSFEAIECCIARAVDAVGDPWSLLILRHALLGARKFSDFEEGLDIPSSTLTRRLAELTEKGLFAPRLYEAHPPRADYELTEKGRALLPVLLVLADWGARFLAPEGPPLELRDACSGARISPRVVDEQTGRVLGPGDVALRPGPGASEELRSLFCGRSVVFGGEL